MEQSPWKGDSFLASHEILCLLWNQNSNSNIHRNLQLVHILIQMLPVHTVPPSLFKICFTVILTSLLLFFNYSFPVYFLAESLYVLVLSPMHATCHAHVTLLDLIVLIMYGEEHKVWSLSLQN
jgi:hypothetical protein